jgi:hypothetical protein
MNDVTAAAAEQHNHDVRRILTDLRGTDFHTEDQIVAAVIDRAFQLAVARDETTEQRRTNFEAWARLIIATARAGDAALDRTLWTESLKTILRAYLAIAAAADGVGTLDARIRQVDAQAKKTLAADELRVAQFVSGVLQGSMAMWHTDLPASMSAKAKAGSIDKSQVARADVMGAITGMAGAAIAAPWTGGLSGAAVGAAAGVGAVLGSATDLVMQDTANDAVEDAEPTPVGP